MPLHIVRRMDQLEAALRRGRARSIIVQFVERRDDGRVWKRDGLRVTPGRPIEQLHGNWELVN